MKTKTSLLLTIICGISFTAVNAAFAQGTAFTYQGLLTTSNGPVNGTYDLTVALWDSLAGGSQIGNSITNPGWHVSGGQLTMPLDFGPNFSGMPLWLEIGVRTNGAVSFSTLSPRQALTPTPYAIYAESANGLANGVALGGGMGNVIVPGTLDSFIGGGNANNILDGSMNSAIAGGMGNIVQSRAAWSFIGGGQNNQTFSAFSSIGGGGGNVITANANYATVGGGFQNTASGLYATVGGGSNNVASGYASTVGGGDPNHATGAYSFIGGGDNNTASGAYSSIVAGSLNVANNTYSSVSGGEQNTASGFAAAVLGGDLNTASGYFATVAGGAGNAATGDHSFACGYDAQAMNTGSFVWADTIGGNYYSDRDNQFKIRANSGVVMDIGGAAHLNPPGLRLNVGSSTAVGLWVITDSSDANAVFSNGGTGDIIRGFNGVGTMVFEVLNNGDVSGHSFNSTSDRNAKENFVPVSPVKVLEKVNSLPISHWNFIGGQSDVQHIGPMAQDFHAAFGLNGADDTHISLTDEGGVALAAIQGLNQKLEDRLESKDAEIAELKARLESIERFINTTKGEEQ